MVQGGFQSLSRDSGRLNLSGWAALVVERALFQSLSRDSGRLNLPPHGPGGPQPGLSFNPSVGIRGV